MNSGFFKWLRSEEDVRVNPWGIKGKTRLTELPCNKLWIALRGLKESGMVFVFFTSIRVL